MVYIASFIKKLDPLLFHHILALTATNRGKISRSIQKVLHSQHIQNVLRSQRQSLQRVYREKIQTVEELQQCITEEWGRLTCVSSTTQRNSGVSASVLVSLQTADILNICCECRRPTTFAINSAFYDHREFCLSVRPSVCLSNECIVRKRNKDLSRFLYHTKGHLA